MIVPPAQFRTRFSLEDRIVAALEIAAEESGSVRISSALLASLAYDLLHCPLPELEATRAQLAAAHPLPEGVTP